MLYLHDGPVGSAIHWAAINYDNFILPITEKRDLIVFDLRGSGLSLPNLDCPEVTTVQRLDQRGSLASEQKPNTYSAALATCRERLASYGIDASKYTTEASANDAHDVIRALGLEKVNLFSVSYGSRLAQIILREYPQDIRSAIFDSPLPLEVNLYKEVAAHYDQALDALFTHCETDPICDSTYPDLDSVYERLLAELDSEPIQITIPGEPGMPDYEMWLDGQTLTRAMLSALNSSFYITSLPKIISDINSGERETSLAFIQSALRLPVQPLLELSSGMRFSTDCHEQIFSTTPQELEQAQMAFPRTSALGMQSILNDGELLYSLCDLWGAAPYESGNNQPIQSDHPILVMAGQFDTLYPANLARQLAEDLSSARFLEFPGSGHAPAFDRRSSCPIRIVNSFLDNPEQLPETTCLDSLTLSYYTIYTGEPPLELLPVEWEGIGFQAQAPAGWTELGQGIFRREAYYGDFTELQIQVSESSASDWLAALTDGFKGAGFDRTPARNTTRFANRLNWNLYRAFSGNHPVELAFAESGEQTLMVLLLSQSSERDALYRTVFMPTIDGTSLR